MAWDQLRTSYDTVAGAYDERFDDELDGKPRDRELLDAFAAAVADPVLDLGCGPGQIGRRVHDAGRHVVGLDLSAAMAQRADARLTAAGVADMRALPVAPASLGGIVAFYALIHLQRHEVVAVLRDLRVALHPGGRLLVAVHEGEGVLHVDELLGAPVPFIATLFALDELVAMMTAAGFEITLAERRAPYETEHATHRLYVEARRPDR